MPGVVALTATLGLTNQTLPYGLQIAELGVEEAVRTVADIRKGVNLWDGKIVCRAVAESLRLEYSELNL
jgi:alanine dehydrogenase